MNARLKRWSCWRTFALTPSIPFLLEWKQQTSHFMVSNKSFGFLLFRETMNKKLGCGGLQHVKDPFRFFRWSLWTSKEVGFNNFSALLYFLSERNEYSLIQELLHLSLFFLQEVFSVVFKRRNENIDVIILHHWLTASNRAVKWSMTSRLIICLLNLISSTNRLWSAMWNPPQHVVKWWQKSLWKWGRKNRVKGSIWAEICKK